MNDFWQYFAVGFAAFVVGVQLGKAIAINQFLLTKQQAAQPEVNPQMMAQLLGGMRQQPHTPPNNTH